MGRNQTWFTSRNFSSCLYHHCIFCSQFYSFIPLFLGTLIAGLIFLPISPMTIAIFFAALLALTIGVIDDKLNAKSRDVPAYFRFLVNILTAVIVVGSGVSIHFITNPYGGILHLDRIAFP